MRAAIISRSNSAKKAMMFSRSCPALIGQDRGIILVMKNFHVPLPDETYEHLRAAAKRLKIPATALAREAIDFWLRQQLRKARHDAITAYAAEMAGTALDLDANLETAGIGKLMKLIEEGREAGRGSLGGSGPAIWLTPAQSRSS
jgi:hypothetical protein